MAYAQLPAIDLAAGPIVRGLVGPNAVTQLQCVLDTRFTPTTTREVFAGAGFARLVDDPPEDMIDAAVPAALFSALWQRFPSMAPEIAWQAGLRTGEYILANRIPAPVRWLLKALPASAASPLLLGAIQRHAWTFAGEGTCEIRKARAGKPAEISIRNNPLAMPECAWHRGVFTALFRSLVCPGARIEHTDCEHEGAPACRFLVHLSRFERGAAA